VGTRYRIAGVAAVVLGLAIASSETYAGGALFGPGAAAMKTLDSAAALVEPTVVVRRRAVVGGAVVRPIVRPVVRPAVRRAIVR
jgi:hypothetical protein